PALPLAVIPRRALRRRLGESRIPLEHPVAELPAHREDAPEKPRLAQFFQLEKPRQPQLVLHDTVLHARFLSGAVEVERGREGRRDRLFAVDVLARRDRLLDELRAQLRGSRVEEHRIVGIPERRGKIGRPALDGMLAGESLHLLAVTPDEYRVGHEPRPVRELDAPILPYFQYRADEVLVRAHPPGDTMHDDS